MHDHEERLEPVRDGAADSRIRADVPKPCRALSRAEPELAAEEEAVDRRHPRLLARRDRREVEDLHAGQFCAERLGVEACLLAPDRAQVRAGAHVARIEKLLQRSHIRARLEHRENLLTG